MLNLSGPVKGGCVVGKAMETCIAASLKAVKDVAHSLQDAPDTKAVLHSDRYAGKPFRFLGQERPVNEGGLWGNVVFEYEAQGLRLLSPVRIWDLPLQCDCIVFRIRQVQKVQNEEMNISRQELCSFWLRTAISLSALSAESSGFPTALHQHLRFGDVNWIAPKGPAIKKVCLKVRVRTNRHPWSGISLHRKELFDAV